MDRSISMKQKILSESIGEIKLMEIMHRKPIVIMKKILNSTMDLEIRI